MTISHYMCGDNWITEGIQIRFPPLCVVVDPLLLDLSCTRVYGELKYLNILKYLSKLIVIKLSISPKLFYYRDFLMVGME